MIDKYKHNLPQNQVFTREWLKFVIKIAVDKLNKLEYCKSSKQLYAAIGNGFAAKKAIKVVELLTKVQISTLQLTYKFKLE